MRDEIRMVRNHPFLVCIDSDGCAIDGMNIKHKKCFGPCAIEEWELFSWEEELLDYWNQVNLYSLTRGINRFKGLRMFLNYTIERGYLQTDLTIFQAWINETTELSNDSLARMLKEYPDETLRRALSWSQKVNQRIAKIPESEKKAFDGVKEVLEKIRQKADLVVVSAANRDAIVGEWDSNRLLSYVSLCMGQEYGDKTSCIQRLLMLGNDPDHVVMLGDAPGDYQAAKANDVLFYPIRAGEEAKSWNEFGERVFELFLQGRYTKQEEQFYLDGFRKRLS